MAYTKKRVRQHMMEDQSIRIVRDTLPEQWVVREYRPDYGIDLTVELFEFTDPQKTVAATLGETLFVQVKSTEFVRPSPLRVHRRRNVELGPLEEDATESTEIEIARLQLETSELLTVQAMGAAVPVLLFLVSLSDRRIYFVCLNDLIEKVVLPGDPEYHAKASRTIHIPLRNCITAADPASVLSLGTYAKRAKLYAAFEKFAYQLNELEYAYTAYREAPTEERAEEAASRIVHLIRHFLAVILRYDFWTRIPEWRLIGHSHQELAWAQECLQTECWRDDQRALQDALLSQPGQRWDEEFIRSLALSDAQSQMLEQITWIWRRLANLSGIYEEVLRERFLPTYLATHL